MMGFCSRVCWWRGVAFHQRALIGDGAFRATITSSSSSATAAALPLPVSLLSASHGRASFTQTASRPRLPPSSVSLDASTTITSTDAELEDELVGYHPPPRRRHLCYYYSQGLCTLEKDPSHLAKFTHDYPDFTVDPLELKKLQPQPFEYYLVLDLEGMVEILEFPVVMVNAKTLQVVDRFHRFVRPVKMSNARIDEYIEGKYGRWGLDRVWHDTAIPFTDVLKVFESWMESHGIWNAAQGGKMKQAAFVTCGNWDVKTKIPQQCTTSSTHLPAYFWEWVNLKDIYLNFYKKRAGGMQAMLKGLQMPMVGTHHVGLDDAHNIARVLQRILIDGGIVKVTAKRSSENPSEVKFRFKSRIK